MNMYNYKISKQLGRILNKLSKKDKKLYENLLNKMDEVLSTSDVECYKNLKHNLKKYQRVHVSHFVLIFRYDKEKDLIFFEDFAHHDTIYKKRI